MSTWTGPGEFSDVLDRARAGDERAFAVLWRWLQPRLLRWLAVVAPDHVEDLASEVWISVARGLPAFDGDEADFRGWVFTLGRRRAIDLGRRRRRQPPVAQLDGRELGELVREVGSIEETVALDAALSLLRGLSMAQSEVIALRIIAGLTVAETAAVVNKSEGAVRVLCHRGLRTLARRMQDNRPAREVAR